jgi:hypothetical protein
MSYRHTLAAALESLHEIEELVKGFSGKGDIPPIELDLSLQKLRNLYELLLMFRKQPEPELAEQPAPAAKAVSEEVIPEVKIASETPVVPAKKAESIRKRPGESQILSDRFKGRSTLHESLHQSLVKEKSTLAQAKPVINLMSAIGINDRFTFIRELFNNDTPAFENTMSILNEANSFNDAYNYMIQQFDWDMDSDAVQLLLEIIRRKYITGRNE